MKIIVVGLNHKTAPIDLRERLSYRKEELGIALGELQRSPLIHESLILSTCNRVELYAVTDSMGKGMGALENYLSQSRRVPKEEMTAHLYRFGGKEAVQHILRVASSLDSMVVGEPQILGQVKEAYSAATGAHSTGVILNRLMHHVFAVAKRIRTETGIARQAASIGTAAVDLAEKIFGDLNQRSVLVVGAGEMCKAVVRQFKKHGLSQIKVANRTFDRAVALAEHFQGTPLHFHRLGEALEAVDVVITSTAAFEPIIGAESVHCVMKKRRWRPMFFIDIAVPRDVEPEVHRIENVYLYNVDDLEEVVRENIKERLREAEQGERVVIDEARRFDVWLKSLDAVPTIVSLNEKLERIRETEFKKCEAALRNGVKDPFAEAERMSRAIIKKILHDLLTKLKRHGEGPEHYLYLDTVRKLFNLELEKEGEVSEGEEEG